MNKRKSLMTAMVALTLAAIVLIVVWFHQSQTQDPAPSFDFEIDTSSPNTAAIPSISIGLGSDSASTNAVVMAEPQETAGARRDPIIDQAIPKTLPIVENRIDILGKFLFESKLLSKNQKISCASCHDPELQFADGLEQSKGVLEVEVGANSPSLIAMGGIKAFPAKTPEGAIRALSLEERCVAPIVNPVEMGSKIEPVLRKLAADPRAKREFKRAFPKSTNPVSEQSIGRALAAFVRKLKPDPTPYERYLAGEWGVLNSQEKTGIAVFKGPGKCNKCHYGDNLSDGAIHKTSIFARRGRFGGFRARKKLAKAIKMHTKEGSDERKELMSRILGEGISLYSSGVLSQTLPLWDVARTAPYFRDGSVSNLRQAITTHIKELRTVRSPARGVLVETNSEKRRLVEVTIPRSLLPKWIDEEQPPKPAELSKFELESLVAFLGTLSPN